MALIFQDVGHEEAGVQPGAAPLHVAELALGTEAVAGIHQT